MAQPISSIHTSTPRTPAVVNVAHLPTVQKSTTILQKLWAWLSSWGSATKTSVSPVTQRTIAERNASALFLEGESTPGPGFSFTTHLPSDDPKIERLRAVVTTAKNAQSHPAKRLTAAQIQQIEIQERQARDRYLLKGNECVDPRHRPWHSTPN